MDVEIKRVYEPPAVTDGYRVLVDRLWPRGLSRDRVRLDEWARDLAPSDELRRVTVLFAARDTAPSNAAALADVLRRGLPGS